MKLLHSVFLIISLLNITLILLPHRRKKLNKFVQVAIKKLYTQYNLPQKTHVLIIYPPSQTLLVIQNKKIIRHYKISTGKDGMGCSRNNLLTTPVGTHRIKQKVGHNAPLGTIFKCRINTKKIATISQSKTITPGDLITSRIMWLEGMEPGINKGGNVDTFARYIYIHGTPDEGLIGKPVSHGCIRMKNKDVIELFSLLPEGTLVEIIG